MTCVKSWLTDDNRVMRSIRVTLNYPYTNDMTILSNAIKLIEKTLGPKFIINLGVDFIEIMIDKTYK
jgi:hypothetical protein